MGKGSVSTPRGKVGSSGRPSDTSLGHSGASQIRRFLCSEMWRGIFAPMKVTKGSLRHVGPGAWAGGRIVLFCTRINSNVLIKRYWHSPRKKGTEREKVQNVGTGVENSYKVGRLRERGSIQKKMALRPN